MKLRIIVLGSKMPEWIAAGYAEYARRMPRDYALDLVELKPEARDRGRTVAQLLAAEGARIDAATTGFLRIALDERGSAWTSRMLSERLARWRDEARDVAFLIGSADGLDPALKRAADERFALSALTLPHGLVRVLLAEQMYRAVALLTGHPYHRD